MRRLISIGAATAFALLVAAPFTGVANAQVACTTDTAYTAPSTLAVAPSVVEEGGVIQATGCGTPGATQTFVLTSHPQTLGTTVTGANGAFSASLPVPCGTEAGRHTLTASEPNGRSQSAALTVDGVTGTCVGAGGAARQAGSGSGGGGALPRTGTASLAPLTAAGVGLVFIGAFAVTAARRRSAQATGS